MTRLFRASTRALALGALAWAGLASCGTHEPPPAAGCEAADDCASPYVCVNFVCRELPEDTGAVDTSVTDTGTSQPDTSVNACAEFVPETLELGETPLGVPLEGVAMFRNCGDVTLTLQDVLVGDARLFEAWPQAEGEVVLAPDDSVAIHVALLAEFAGIASSAVEVSTDRTYTRLPVDGFVIPTPESMCLNVPPSVQLGSLSLPGVLVEAFEVTNCGEVRADFALAIDGADRDVFRVISGDRSLEPGTTGTYFVEFAPDDPGTYQSQLFFQSEEAEYHTTLRATAVTSSAAPCVALSPSLLDFGQVTRGTDAVGFVDLQNCGTRPLAFDRPTMDGDTGAFIEAPAPDELGPGATETLVFSARGDRAGTHQATYVLPIAESTHEVAIELTSEVR